MGPRTRPFPVALMLAAAGCASAPEPASVRLELRLRIAGEAPGGELGFRFGSPRDVDGDGVADIAAGARAANLEFTQMGYVAAWSTRAGEQLAYWEGHGPDALFGQAALAGPDADGDGVADVVASAPNGNYHGANLGILYARSARSGRLIWSAVGERDEGFGWHLALAADQNGDGVEDLLVGTPCTDTPGKAYLISGRDGSRVRTFTSDRKDDRFGWYASAVPDLDGDGREDLLVGAPSTPRGEVVNAGAVHVFSSTGQRLRILEGERPNGIFGEVVAGLADLDGDGAGEILVGAPSLASLPAGERPPGEVTVFSGATGKRLQHWAGRDGVELYGRMVARAGDLDRDGAEDIAIGAPWSAAGGHEKAGRFEVRSGRTGQVLAGVAGDRPLEWLGWHIAAAEGIGRGRERGLVVSALRSEENGLVGAGALLVYVAR